MSSKRQQLCLQQIQQLPNKNSYLQCSSLQTAVWYFPRINFSCTLEISISPIFRNLLNILLTDTFRTQIQLYTSVTMYRKIFSDFYHCPVFYLQCIFSTLILYEFPYGLAFQLYSVIDQTLCGYIFFFIKYMF